MVDSVPRPKAFTPRDGSIDLSAITWIQAGGDDIHAAGLLAADLETLSGRRPDIDGRGGGRSGGRSGARSGVGVILRRGGAVDESGGYTIESAESGITIVAGGSAGLLNGVQTVRQYAIRSQVSFPAGSVTDRPAFSWRGLHFDVSRHFFKLSYIRRLLDIMALHKLNIFHWHLTDDQGWRMAIEQYPNLINTGAYRTEPGGKRYGGYYTKAELREVVRYAGDLGITVVPEIELPGHAQAAVASYPNLSCRGGAIEVWNSTGVSKEVFCAGKEETYSFLKNVFDEVLDVFPSTFIHVGGDECPKDRWNECPDCQKRIEDEGLADADELQSYFVGRIDKYLSSKGRRLIGWDEILEGGLAAGAAVMSWRGTEGGAAAVGLGHDAVMCPHTHVYFDYRQTDTEGALGPFYDAPRTDLSKVYAFSPNDGIPSPGGRILGGQCNIWTEAIDTEARADHMIFPRLGAFAEAVWLPSLERDPKEFAGRLGSYRKFLDGLSVAYCDLAEAWQ